MTLFYWCSQRWTIRLSALWRHRWNEWNLFCTMRRERSANLVKAAVSQSKPGNT